MVQVDPVELADLASPEQLVAELLRQNPQMPVPIPVEDLARAAGIEEVKVLPSEQFEGALICDDVKSRGVILYNGSRPRTRQRFTIAHELGHFLLPWQRRTSFECVSKDLNLTGADTDWEVQASRFAAELLLPQRLFEQELRKLGDPELINIVQLGDHFGTSIEYTARRYVEVGGFACAVVFSKDNQVRYTVRGEFFEHWLCVKKGDRLPTKSSSRAATGAPEDWASLDAHWWLQEATEAEPPDEVYEQTLWQDNGYKVTLLTYDV